MDISAKMMRALAEVCAEWDGVGDEDRATIDRIKVQYGIGQVIINATHKIIFMTSHTEVPVIDRALIEKELRLYTIEWKVGSAGQTIN